MNLSRRELIKIALAGGVVTAAGVWWPGQKLISIPKVRKGTLVYKNFGDVYIRENIDISRVKVHQLWAHHP